MAQFLYSGIQGSGKSYEVVQGVIVPNVAKGRRVVTNVTGLQYDKICDYCVSYLGADRSKLGEIVQIDNEQVDQPNFFPLEESDSPIVIALKKATDPELIKALEIQQEIWKNSFIVKGGDIVILDECWRWYTADSKLPDGHLKFFRMHRHFLHAVTGQCCDIVLIAQDIGDLRRNIRATIEKSFLMQKHTDLGLLDRYVVTAYSGNKQVSKSFIEDFQKKYDPAIFALYQSHSQKSAGGADAREERVDKRGSLFNRKIIKYGMPIALLWIGFAAYFIWGYFHKAPPVPAVSPAAAAPLVVGGSEPLKPLSPVPASKSAGHAGYSEDWRLVGVVDGVVKAFVLRDSQGRQRLVSAPPAVKYSFGEIELALPGGEFVAQWSGPSESKK